MFKVDWRLWLMIICLWPFGAGGVATAETAKPDERLRTMTLIGTGSVTAAPDMAVISVGVVRVARTAREALSANNEAMASIFAALAEAGLKPKDIQTSGFSVQPRYNYDNKRQVPPAITGYEVSNQVSAIVRDLKILGQTLDQVVSLGSNQINSVRFEISKPAPLRDEARRRATANALAKAKLYAEAAGVELGPIQRISEQGGYRPPRPYAAQAMVRRESAGSAPVSAGEHEITMQVHIVWQIK